MKLQEHVVQNVFYSPEVNELSFVSPCLFFLSLQHTCTTHNSSMLA